MLWFILFFIVCLLVYYKVKKSYSYWRERGVKYVEPTFPFGAFNFRQGIDKTFGDVYTAFPEERYIGFYQFLLPSLMIKDPELIKQITVKEFDSFMDHRQIAPDDVDSFINKNLFTLTGSRWRDLRATLSPSFTGSKMKFMFPLIEECAKHFVNHFDSILEENKIKEIEMKDVVRRFTNDVIASTAFGLKYDSLKDDTNDFYIVGKEFTNISGLKVIKMMIPVLFPTISKIFNIKVVSNKLRDYFTNLITSTVEQREKQNIVRPDMIHLLMEAMKGRLKEEEELKVNEGFATVEESSMIKTYQKRPITVEDIVAQAFIFFVAGFETVSTALSFTFYELARNPDIQSRLRDELSTIEGEITYEKILSLKYLDMCISEVLRLWPPTVMLDRKCTKPFTIQPEKPGERTLELATNDIVFIHHFAMHRDPKYYDNPERFDPERFSDENKHKIQPFTYLPFGVGPRNCIGSRFALLEIKLLLFHTLRKFEVIPVKKSPIPMVLEPMILTPKNKMWLGLKKL